MNTFLKKLTSGAVVMIITIHAPGYQDELQKKLINIYSSISRLNPNDPACEALTVAQAYLRAEIDNNTEELLDYLSLTAKASYDKLSIKHQSAVIAAIKRLWKKDDRAMKIRGITTFKQIGRSVYITGETVGLARIAPNS